MNFWEHITARAEVFDLPKPICGVCADYLCDDHARDCAFAPDVCDCPTKGDN